MLPFRCCTSSPPCDIGALLQRAGGAGGWGRPRAVAVAPSCADAPFSWVLTPVPISGRSWRRLGAGWHRLSALPALRDTCHRVHAETNVVCQHQSGPDHLDIVASRNCQALIENFHSDVYTRIGLASDPKMGIGVVAVKVSGRHRTDCSRFCRRSRTDCRRRRPPPPRCATGHPERQGPVPAAGRAVLRNRGVHFAPGQEDDRRP